MINATRIVFQNFPVGPLEGVSDKIYIDKLGAHVRGQTLGIYSNESGGKLFCVSILEQPSLYATQSVSIPFPVPKNPGATVTYPNGNLTAPVVSEKTRENEENIRIWKE